MRQQLKKANILPQMPKKKMPSARAAMMLGVALCFSMLIFIFSILPITAPIVLGIGTEVYAENATGSETIGKAAGWVAGVSTGVAEFISGVGVAVVGFIGEMMSFALTILGWAIFYAWFVAADISLMGGSSANKRFAIAGVSLVIGMIPFLDIIPGLIIGIVLIVMNVRREDKENLAKYEQKLKEYNAYKKNLLSRRIALQQILAQQAVANDSNFGGPDKLAEAT